MFLISLPSLYLLHRRIHSLFLPFPLPTDIHNSPFNLFPNPISIIISILLLLLFISSTSIPLCCIDLSAVLQLPHSPTNSIYSSNSFSRIPFLRFFIFVCRLGKNHFQGKQPEAQHLSNISLTWTSSFYNSNSILGINID